MDDKVRDRIRSSLEHIRVGVQLSIRTRRTIEITRAMIARSAHLAIKCGVCGHGLQAGESLVRHDATLAHAGCKEGVDRLNPAA